jgi:hypothetical protein
MRVGEDSRAFVDRLRQPLEAKVSALTAIVDDVLAVHARVRGPA